MTECGSSTQRRAWRRGGNLARSATGIVAGGFVAAMILAMGRPASASAFNLEGCSWPVFHFPISNFQYILYDNQESAGTPYATAIDTAASRWSSTPTRLALVSVGGGNAQIDAFAISYGATGFDGLTQYICSEGQFAPPVYASANVYYTDGYDQDGKNQILVHEFGHSMGLAHNNPALCGIPIMYYSSARYFTCHLDSPQSDDDKGINAIYGAP